MIETLKAVENIIKNDSELKTLFNAEDNRKFMYIGVTPFDAQLPVLVIDFGHRGTNNLIVDELIINFDIYDRNTTLYRILKIIERLEKLMFNFQPENVSKNTIKFIKKNYGSLVPDSDEEIQHYVLNFSIYFGRSELVNQ